MLVDDKSSECVHLLRIYERAERPCDLICWTMDTRTILIAELRDRLTRCDRIQVRNVRNNDSVQVEMVRI